ncbi:hypothetical protein C8R46DRAFT_1201606 [Mycena filopes]|nr:hypothetical protein C8R46DRAFT_1201606 [Mycena filopes]
MRFFFSLLVLFALLLTLATATTTTPNNDADDRDHDSRVAMNLFRPWTWTLPAFQLPAQPDAAALHLLSRPTAYHILMITTLPAMYLLLSLSTDLRNIGPFPPIYLYGLIVTAHVHLKGRINYQ